MIFKCDLCDYTSDLKHNLTRHKKETHGQSAKGGKRKKTALAALPDLPFLPPPELPPPPSLPVAYGLIGLPNLSNTCYLNSSIQCLVSLKSFMSFFRRDDLGTQYPGYPFFLIFLLLASIAISFDKGLSGGGLMPALHALSRSLSMESTSATDVRKKMTSFVKCIRNELKGSFRLFNQIILFTAI